MKIKGYTLIPKKKTNLARNDQQGFTLIELLIVLGIITILSIGAITIINPMTQFKRARDLQRKNDISAIMNAAHQYEADHNGVPPTEIPLISTNIGSGVSDVNLCTLLVTKYIGDIPIDPSAGTKTPSGSNCKDSGVSYSSGYKISKSETDNRITVSATGEITENIEVTR